MCKRSLLVYFSASLPVGRVKQADLLVKVLKHSFGVPQINEKQEALTRAEAKEAAESEALEAKRREHNSALTSFGKEDEALATAHAAARVRFPQTAGTLHLLPGQLFCPHYHVFRWSQCVLLNVGSRSQGGCCYLQAAEDVVQTIVQKQEQLGAAIQQLRDKQAEYLAKSEGNREIANQVLLRALSVFGRFTAVIMQWESYRGCCWGPRLSIWTARGAKLGSQLKVLCHLQRMGEHVRSSCQPDCPYCADVLGGGVCRVAADHRGAPAEAQGRRGPPAGGGAPDAGPAHGEAEDGVGAQDPGQGAGRRRDHGRAARELHPVPPAPYSPPPSCLVRNTDTAGQQQ